MSDGLSVRCAENNGCAYVQSNRQCTDGKQVCDGKTGRCVDCGDVDLFDSYPCCTGKTCKEGLRCSGSNCAVDKSKVQVGDIYFTANYGFSTGMPIWDAWIDVTLDSPGFSVDVLSCDSSGGGSKREISGQGPHKVDVGGNGCWDSKYGCTHTENLNITVVVGYGIGTALCRDLAQGTDYNSDAVYVIKQKKEPSCCSNQYCGDTCKSDCDCH